MSKGCLILLVKFLFVPVAAAVVDKVSMEGQIVAHDSDVDLQ